jgi:ABC-type proline/glycine betaine transport system substrate-binding protein
MRITACLVAAVVLALLPAGAAAAKRSNTRPVLVVANNWDGTAVVIDP